MHPVETLRRRKILFLTLALLLSSLTLQMPCQNLCAAQKVDSSNSKQENLAVIQDNEIETEAYAIPKDGNQRILLWDLTGGFRAPDPVGFERKPKLEIFADGRVIAGTNGPEFEIGKATLSKQQLKELFDFIVKEQKFFETSEADIRAKMQGYRSKMADGLTSMLNIELEDQQQSIAVYTLSMAAREFKDYQPLQRLQAIEQKLREVKMFADAGGDRTINQILKAANQKLKTQGANLSEFTTSDLTTVTQRTDGSLTARLSRTVDNVPQSATVIRSGKEAELTAEVKVGR